MILKSFEMPTRNLLTGKWIYPILVGLTDKLHYQRWKNQCEHDQRYAGWITAVFEEERSFFIAP